MGLSAPRANSPDIISLQIVKKWLGINPMGTIVPWENSLDIIAFQKAKLN